MTQPQASAVVLLSGGLDSTTALAMARARGFRCHALAFRYGQRHVVELERARAVAEALGAASFRVADIDLRAFGGSALTDAALAVPKGRAVDEMAHDIPITYVPARNTIFLSFALALCEVTTSWHIFVGVNALDYSGYPDCRPDYLAAFERLANLATRAGVEGQAQGRAIHVEAPLLHMTKAQIIQAGAKLGVDYAMTWSCYDPQVKADRSGGVAACGACDSCLLRKKGFADAGVADPTEYAT